MRFLFTTLLVLGVWSVSNASMAADDDERIVRFYGGEVVRAELKPGDGGIKIVNVDKYAPRSRVTSDVGVAVVTVRMDKGRTLSLYDYSLVNGSKNVFPCVAIMNSVGEYDDSFREFTKTKPNELYNLLFKVEMPGYKKKPRYILRFNLRRGQKRDPKLSFVVLGKFPFTKTSKIPLEGMLGVIPERLKSKPKPKNKAAKPAPKKKPAKKNAGKN